MKKIMKYTVCLVLILGTTTQCKDYLEVKAPHRNDDAFVTSSLSETNKLLSYLYGEYRTNIIKGRNYMFQDPIGSFAEFNHEAASTNNRNARMEGHLMANLGETGTIALMFDPINLFMGRAELIAWAIEKTQGYRDGNPDWVHAYAEAIAMWALGAFHLAIHFGDVPVGYSNRPIETFRLTNRFDIYDKVISELQRVEGTMYRLGQNGFNADRMTRSFANALIGKAALFAGSWQTIRTDNDAKAVDLYSGRTFTVKLDDPDPVGGCQYVRLTNYMDYLRIAEEYLDKAVNDGDIRGTARLITEDPRPGVDNPAQYHWQVINSRGSGGFPMLSPESFFEAHGSWDATLGEMEHPYSMGRPGANFNQPSLNGHNPQSFAAIRIPPNYFYKAYEATDKRRDFSMTPTGIHTAVAIATPVQILAPTGSETLIPLRPGNRVVGGGPSINKWDFNRSAVPNVLGLFRRSGMSYTIMRMSDVMLMLAEVKAQTGDAPGAVALVNQIRARAGVGNIGALTGDALLDAVYNERALELIGEGTIRHDMVRGGKFHEIVTEARAELRTMIDAIANQGYYTFNAGLPNERTISDYVWVKLVHIDGETKVTQNADPADPAKFPGWRGVHDWNPTGDAKNLAIKGLYEIYVPDDIAMTLFTDVNGNGIFDAGDTNAAGDRVYDTVQYVGLTFQQLRSTIADKGEWFSSAVSTDGYGLINWGADLLAPANQTAMFRNFFGGHPGREQLPPRYFHPMPATTVGAAEGIHVSNGYHLPQD
ncbi:MAG: RagB/SusD family nutrient uptake outer membrane protein [Bacteroidales bacterium]|nr:RagB/SusD family nutrient uptake outer membrane protein [Bacteroidales bacterium]